MSPIWTLPWRGFWSHSLGRSGFRQGIRVSALKRAPEIRLNIPHCSDGKTDVLREEAHPSDQTELFHFLLSCRHTQAWGLGPRPGQRYILADGKGTSSP